MPSTTLKRAGLAGIVLAAVAAGSIGLLAGRQAVDVPRTANGTEAPGDEAGAVDTPGETASAGTATGGELVEFRHEQAGFAISYPKAWVRPEASNPQVALVAAENDPAQNQGGSILVRVTALEAAVGKEQLGEAKQATDAIVAAGTGVQLKAEPAEITQGGLPGFYYFYTFDDSVSSRRGAHAHYFLFHGQTMVSLVFQALPEDDFIRLAPLFDRVADSFRVLGPGS